MNRRHFIKAAATLPVSMAISKNAFAELTSNQPLYIPELYSVTTENGVKKFNLNAQYGTTEFFKGYGTETLGYNGSYLGPTLKMKKGDKVSIAVKNNLKEETTVHWHGMVLPAKMDGGPHQTIKPGSSWQSDFEVIQNASTLFYHSHAHGQTGQQVYRGLAGLLLIDDEESEGLGLPSEYGVDDIPVILQDRDFNSDASFKYLSFMPERMIGKHGNTLLVNGAVSPRFKASKSLIRLRLVNASNARFYNLIFSDHRTFKIIASDGGLLEQPVIANRLEMAPAERYDILLDVSDKKPVMLQSIGGVGNASHGPMGMMGMDKSFDVLMIDSQNTFKMFKFNKSPAGVVFKVTNRKQNCKSSFRAANRYG